MTSSAAIADNAQNVGSQANVGSSINPPVVFAIDSNELNATWTHECGAWRRAIVHAPSVGGLAKVETDIDMSAMFARPNGLPAPQERPQPEASHVECSRHVEASHVEGSRRKLK
jgi:hypothetical protein